MVYTTLCMATSKIVLPNGTIITIDGKPEEIKTVLSFYNHSSKEIEPTKKKRNNSAKQRQSIKVSDDSGTDAVMEIVTSIKESDDAENIETNVLDRPSQIDRILLPLYINQKYLENRHFLTTGEIAKVLAELGVPISVPNVSNGMTTSASKYVVGDKARKKGQAVKYKLSRRGFQYMSAVVGGSGHDKQS